jgi:hypothetical protein
MTTSRATIASRSDPLSSLKTRMLIAQSRFRQAQWTMPRPGQFSSFGLSLRNYCFTPTSAVFAELVFSVVDPVMSVFFDTPVDSVLSSATSTFSPAMTPSPNQGMPNFVACHPLWSQPKA